MREFHPGGFRLVDDERRRRLERVEHLGAAPERKHRRAILHRRRRRRAHARAGELAEEAASRAAGDTLLRSQQIPRHVLLQSRERARVALQRLSQDAGHRLHVTRPNFGENLRGVHPQKRHEVLEPQQHVLLDDLNVRLGLPKRVELLHEEVASLFRRSRAEPRQLWLHVGDGGGVLRVDRGVDVRQPPIELDEMLQVILRHFVLHDGANELGRYG